MMLRPFEIRLHFPTRRLQPIVIVQPQWRTAFLGNRLASIGNYCKAALEDVRRRRLNDHLKSNNERMRPEAGRMKSCDGLYNE